MIQNSDFFYSILVKVCAKETTTSLLYVQKVLFELL